MSPWARDNFKADSPTVPEEQHATSGRFTGPTRDWEARTRGTRVVQSSVHPPVTTGTAWHTVAQPGGADAAPRADVWPLCADMDGFSLHAGVWVAARDRERLEKLCRYAGRPAIAESRLSLLADGRVAYSLKKKWKDGTSHVVLEPQVLMERLRGSTPRETGFSRPWPECCMRHGT